MATGDIDAVIFDLGGVLADFGGVKPMRDLAGLDSDEEVWRRWLGCRWVREFERGRCSAAEFATGVVSDWSLTVTPAEFLDEFRSWVAEPLPGAESLVSAVRERVPVGCLSNTNHLHWLETGSRWDLVGLFDFRFLSFELGLVKPDTEIFEHVLQQIDMAPARVVFLDDNAPNVEAAAEVGFVAAQVRGVDEARRVLSEAGLIG